MRKGVDPGAEQSLRVLEVEDMRGHPETMLVRLVDDRRVNLRCHLLVLAASRIDPDLDDVDLLLRQFQHRLAAFLRAVYPVRNRRAPRLLHGDASARAQKPRRAGDSLIAQIEHVVVIRAEAERGAHAVVGAHLQVPDEHVAILAEMNVSIDDHRHDRLAREIDAPGAGGHANVAPPADLCDLFPVDHQGPVVDHAPVADDQPRAVVHRDRLLGHRNRARAQEPKGSHQHHRDHVESSHGNLPASYVGHNMESVATGDACRRQRPEQRFSPDEISTGRTCLSIGSW